MQTLRRRHLSLSNGLPKVVLDRHLPACFPLRNSSLTCIINSLLPSRCFRTRNRGPHNLSSRYKSLESNIRPEYLRKHAEEEIEHPLASGEEYLPSAFSQKPFLDTGVSALQMERITIRGKSILRPKSIPFHGISIPPNPPPPASDGMFPFKVVCLLFSGHTILRTSRLIF